MSARAKAMANLYRRGKVTMEGLKQAVADGVITAEQYKELVCEDYPAEK